jgi:hypothetical protein
MKLINCSIDVKQQSLKSSMTGVASGAANAYTSVALFFSEIRVTQSLVFCVVFSR